jgi:UDP-N-acetyl-D-mannosaminuronic acid dehydrogenase
VAGSQVLVLGYAYLENADDTRESPSETLVQALKNLGVDLVIHDPWVAAYQGDLLAMAHGCDAAILMVKHSAYYEIDLSALKNALNTPILVDGRHVFDPVVAQMSGLIYRGVGQGVEAQFSRQPDRQTIPLDTLQVQPA